MRKRRSLLRGSVKVVASALTVAGLAASPAPGAEVAAVRGAIAFSVDPGARTAVSVTYERAADAVLFRDRAAPIAAVRAASKPASRGELALGGREAVRVVAGDGADTIDVDLVGPIDPVIAVVIAGAGNDDCTR